ncbi:hypothetical protein [Chitiniphilus eburneus]|uniref:Uncharacterized protein n=1 Tax=Chitiniphilus eburneus TaxID=2571148 RepID=A0A4U0PFY5_9NEIS|nr:hypothetical protein [Chitiniphilus eburneus]TJZ66851.1 hypothetical protein FAZ21_16845 [Chitiniphilus eburneus]
MKNSFFLFFFYANCAMAQNGLICDVRLDRVFHDKAQKEFVYKKSQVRDLTEKSPKECLQNKNALKAILATKKTLSDDIKHAMAAVFKEGDRYQVSLHNGGPREEFEFGGIYSCEVIEGKAFDCKFDR